MRITYIILVLIVLLRTNNWSQSRSYERPMTCRFWFESCASEVVTYYEKQSESVTQHFIKSLRNYLLIKIAKHRNKDLKGIYSVLYLSNWSSISPDNEIYEAIDYFSLIFLLVISGFHFNIASSVLSNILNSLFGLFNVLHILNYDSIVSINKIINLVKIIFLFYFCQFYSFNPSVVRAYVVEVSNFSDAIADDLGIELKFCDLYIFGIVFGVDIFSISYFLSWMCYLIFSARFNHQTIIDLLLKTILSSILCLALFGRLSFLSIAVAMICSLCFGFVYIVGLISLVLESDGLFCVSDFYWLAISKFYSIPHATIKLDFTIFKEYGFVAVLRYKGIIVRREN